MAMQFDIFHKIAKNTDDFLSQKRTQPAGLRPFCSLLFFRRLDQRIVSGLAAADHGQHILMQQRVSPSSEAALSRSAEAVPVTPSENVKVNVPSPVCSSVTDAPEEAA